MSNNLEVIVSGEIDPVYGIDIVETVSLGEVEVSYVTENGVNSYSFRSSEAAAYLEKLFEDDPELFKQEEQERSGLYYFEKNGETEVTSVPSPSKYEARDKIDLRNLAFTESEQFAYSLRAESDEEHLEFRNSYSYEAPGVEKTDKVYQFFDLVGNLKMLLEE